MFLNRVYIAFGFLSMGCGFLGMVLPVLPTTCFMILAAYFFSKGSPRLHNWIRSLKTVGPMICDWEAHKVIRPRAKIMATAMILFALALVCLLSVSTLVKIGTASTLALVLVFIWTRKSEPSSLVCLEPIR